MGRQRAAAATVQTMPMICADVDGSPRMAHTWVIPATPYADVDALGRQTPWDLDDTRRDWTCRLCAARKPAEEKLRRGAIANAWPAARIRKEKAQALKDAAVRADAARLLG